MPFCTLVEKSCSHERFKPVPHTQYNLSPRVVMSCKLLCRPHWGERQMKYLGAALILRWLGGPLRSGGRSVLVAVHDKIVSGKAYLKMAATRPRSSMPHSSVGTRIGHGYHEPAFWCKRQAMKKGWKSYYIHLPLSLRSREPGKTRRRWTRGD